MARGAEVTIGWVDAPTSVQLDAFADLITVHHREAVPDDRPYPAAELAAELAHHPSHEEVRLALATEGDTVVGGAVLRLDRSGSNRHLAGMEYLIVEPTRRRRGIGTRLLRLVTDAARADGRTDLVDAAPVGHVAGSAFAARVGATPGLVERQNRLSVAELDPTMLERWVDRARERATDYSLVAFDGPCPDELVDGFARLMQVMDTAPRTDIWHDSVVTPEMAREGGAAFQRLGGTSWVVCAREDATGRLVGYSFLGFVVHRPWLGIQGDTGIEPAHRNRGLGRWLKATNALRLLDERPEVEIVETWNADVNAPMLSINTAMGFRQAAAWQEWELRIS